MLKLKVVLVSLMAMLLAGCDLTMEEASASLKIKFLQLVELSVDAKWKKNGEEQQSILGYSVAQALSTGRVELSAHNAHIPTQSTLGTVSLKNSDGAVIAAQTFAMRVFGGVIEFQNPSSVEQWVSTISLPDEGYITISSRDVAVRPPSSGNFTVAQNVYIGSTRVASASASAWVDDGRPKPPTIPLRN